MEVGGNMGSSLTYYWFLYTHGMRGLLDLPIVAICSFYFLAMRCRYSSILSWREEHHQVHHCAKVRSANPVLGGEER